MCRIFINALNLSINILIIYSHTLDVGVTSLTNKSVLIFALESKSSTFSTLMQNFHLYDLR